MVLAPGLLFEVAHAVSQLLYQLVTVTTEAVVGSTSVTVTLVVVMTRVLGAALVGTSRALVVAQYDVHAPALPHVGDGSSLYPGADGVHGDAQGLGGLGYR